MELYDRKKYEEAIVQLKLAATEDSDNASLKCYPGIAYLAAGHAQEAKTTFDAIVKNDHSLFKEVAEWNLAMTYLKFNDEASLKKTLEGIIQQNDHQCHEQPKDLLKRL